MHKIDCCVDTCRVPERGREEGRKGGREEGRKGASEQRVTH